MRLFSVFVVLLSLYAPGAFGQSWTVQNFYSDTTCQTLVGVQYTFGSGACSTVGCTVSGSRSSQQFCTISSVPTLPPTWLVLRTFSTTGCGGTVTNIAATATTSLCLPMVVGSGSWQLSCSGSTLTRTIFSDASCSASPSTQTTSGCTDSAGSSRNSQCPPTCTPSLVQPALSAATIPTGTIGFITTATVTFCTSATSQVFLSGDSSLSGGITVDDMVVYQLDSNGVTGLGFSAACSTSGFLSIASGSVVTGGVSSHGPPILLGTLGAGTHTLQIGTYNCGGAATSSLINVVGCSLVSCSTTTPPTTTTPPSSATVWSGTYTVNAGCSQSQCCCATGSFTMTQVGSQVSGTVNVAGQCGGATSAPFSVTLSSPTATSGMWGQNNLVKNGATVTATNVANSACSATLTCTSGDCLPAASSVCFHESTAITYGGQHWTLDQLLTSSAANPNKQCTVPHVVKATGMIISIACSSSSSSFSSSGKMTPAAKDERTLRLTKDHLVFTRSGLKQASTLIPGRDVLFADLQQTKECRIIAVTPESSEQRYFGLNCLESVVLANGIKTSTFGHYHTIPAAWMSWVGGVLGIDRASQWGDSIVDLLAKMKLL